MYLSKATKQKTKKNNKKKERKRTGSRLHRPVPITSYSIRTKGGSLLNAAH